jgi:hypothetical protein
MWQTLLKEKLLADRTVDASRPNSPHFAGTPWSLKEEAQLAIAFEAGASIDEIAIAHERTKGAIAARLVTLGLIAERSDVYLRNPSQRSKGTFK